VLEAAGTGALIGLTFGAAAPEAAAGLAARTVSLAGAGSAAAAAEGAVAASKLTIEFGRNANQLSHAMRHVEEVGLDAAAVRTAITQHLPTVASQLQPGSPLNQVISVGGQKLQYTAYQVSEGIVNVGRIHPIP
jgi:hypothetical protein